MSKFGEYMIGVLIVVVIVLCAFIISIFIVHISEPETYTGSLKSIGKTELIQGNDPHNPDEEYQCLHLKIDNRHMHFVYDTVHDIEIAYKQIRPYVKSNVTITFKEFTDIDRGWNTPTLYTLLSIEQIIEPEPDPEPEYLGKGFADVIYGIVNISNDTIYYDVLQWDEDIGIYMPLNSSYQYIYSLGSGTIDNIWDYYGIINNTNATKDGFRWILFGVDSIVAVKQLDFWDCWNYDTQGYTWINVRRS